MELILRLKILITITLLRDAFGVVLRIQNIYQILRLIARSILVLKRSLQRTVPLICTRAFFNHTLFVFPYHVVDVEFMVAITIHDPWHVFGAVEEAETAFGTLNVTLLESDVHALSLSAVKL